jgi:hypothetical protein
MFYLYSHIVLTLFAVGKIEEMDLSTRLEPVISSLLGGSIISTVPGVSLVATMVANSIIDGSANAFLALLTGILAKRYFTPCGILEYKEERKAASIEAAQMLGCVMVKSAKQVTESIWKASFNPIKSVKVEIVVFEFF